MQHKTIVHHDEMQDMLNALNVSDEQIADIMFSLGYDLGDIVVDDGIGEPIEVGAWVYNNGLFSVEDNHPDNNKRCENRWRRDMYGYARRRIAHQSRTN